MAGPLIDSGRLYAVPNVPGYPHPTYMVYAKDADDEVIAQALDGSRMLTKI